MLNKVILMGRLTADPELRQTPNGVSTCRFTVAVERNFAQQGQERQTDFITVVAWRQTAEFISRYFPKGRMICVEGNLRTSSYDDRNHPDVKHYVTEVYADQVYFAGDKNPNSGNQQSGYNPNQNQQYAPQQSYQQPAQPQNNQAGFSVGDLSDFEEVIGNNELPF
ncbi:MAG: single-stranded DNA-binding protein [Oscillospiraceae bacterium]